MIDPDIRESMDMIRESAGGIVGEDLTRVRGLRYTAPGFDRAVWREICDMGWPALRVSEAEGGAGLGMLPYCALAEELGRGLLPEPLIPASLAAAFLKDEALARHLSGERLVLPAWQDSRGALGPETPLALKDGKLTATKLYVPMAAGADDFLVIGTDGAALVAADAPGVTVTAQETQDGGTLATVAFADAPAERIAIDPTPALAEATLASSAYLLGLMEAALDMTVAYLKTRVQFGKTIGTFQILQHMAVDLKLETTLTRACVEDAAERWDREGPTPANLAGVSRTRIRAARAAAKVTRDCIQLHGGIGFTDEHDIGLYLRKAMAEAGRFGSIDAHRARYATLKPVGEEA